MKPAQYRARLTQERAEHHPENKKKMQNQNGYSESRINIFAENDGKNWRALHPRPGQPADADKNWNALSLPLVVGPNGRLGNLRDDALKP